MPGIEDEFGPGVVSREEILRDLRYAWERYRASEDCPDGLPSTSALRSEAADIFSRVNRHFDVHYRYSTDDVHYAELEEGVGGVTSFGGLFGGRTEIGVNVRHAGDAALVDYILAHEGTHAALRDGSEWMEELVALDVAYELMDQGARRGIEGVIYQRRLTQAIDALAMKLRRDEGRSEVEIAGYMREELGLTDGVITSFVDVKVVDGEFKKPGWGRSRRGEIEQSSAYHSVPYFAEKYMHKEGKRLNLSLGDTRFQLDLPHLFAHTDDAEARAPSEGAGASAGPIDALDLRRIQAL